jgi:hypothetical protein
VQLCGGADQAVCRPGRSITSFGSVRRGRRLRPGELAVRPALPGSVEELFHQVGAKEFTLVFAPGSQVAERLRGPQ